MIKRYNQSLHKCVVDNKHKHKQFVLVAFWIAKNKSVEGLLQDWETNCTTGNTNDVMVDTDNDGFEGLFTWST